MPAARLMDAVEAAYRQEYGQIVASLIKSTHDWDLAEDSAQEALARAIERWPRDGVPAKPGAWLMTVARRHPLDRLRRSRPTEWCRSRGHPPLRWATGRSSAFHP
jgi:RNA polymerase sigma-70 factor (ECF subfamily)